RNQNPRYRPNKRGRAERGPNHLACAPSVRQRVGPYLDVDGARLRTPATLLEPRRAVAPRAPQPTALPAGIGVVDAAIETLGKEAKRIRDAQHDHLAVLEGRKSVIEVGGRDRNIFAQAHRVVVIDPGVI